MIPRRSSTLSNVKLPTRVATGIARARLSTFKSGGPESKHSNSLAYSTQQPISRSLTTSSVPSPTPLKPLFNKILIANRGEIACRVIRTCRQLGIATVAVFSEIDADSQHVKLADEAYLLGPAPSSQSYLLSDKIIEICKLSGAQAVHPGYGFLSENAKFSEELARNGITFIGPPASAIISMGSKSESKDIMLRAGVPCVPGWHPASDSPASTQLPEFLILEADKIGYPVLIKAVSGGGGKGMKIVENREEFISQLDSAKREAMKGFGDDKVLLEKYLSTPRHVEVQIFSDSQGNHVSLFERDCSVQRRHQKIIEEAPAPFLSQALRENLFDKARKAASAVNYVGAGTVEFIMDANNPDDFYFMEMNTRLQVEHTITEMITGLDLVELQLIVAAGNPIPFKQEEVTCTGHAFECRIYAESPSNNFLPQIGLLQHVKLPESSVSVRIDSGFISGDEISIYYDPLIAKLIVHGSDRTEALRILRRALEDYQVVGPQTNIEFLKRLTKHEAFIAAEVETGFITKHFNSLFGPTPLASPSNLAQAGIYLALRDIESVKEIASDPWSSAHLAGFRIGNVGSDKTFEITEPIEDGRNATVTVSAPIMGAYEVTVVDFEALESKFTKVRPSVVKGDGATSVSALLESKFSKVDIIPVQMERGETLHLFSGDFVGTLEVRLPKWKLALGSSNSGGSIGSAKAPMPSRIIQLLVKEGQQVEIGTPLCIFESMKTEIVLRAGREGVVAKVFGNIGDFVPEGRVIVEFEEQCNRN